MESLFPVCICLLPVWEGSFPAPLLPTFIEQPTSKWSAGYKRGLQTVPLQPGLTKCKSFLFWLLVWTYRWPQDSTLATGFSQLSGKNTFLDEHLVILSYQSSLQRKSNVFLHLCLVSYSSLFSIHFVDSNTIQQESLQKGRICEKEYNLYTFCAERHHAENFGNLLEMFIAAIILAFQKKWFMDSWNLHTLLGICGRIYRMVRVLQKAGSLKGELWRL